jgi:hypothetical protein
LRIGLTVKRPKSGRRDFFLIYSNKFDPLGFWRQDDSMTKRADSTLPKPGIGFASAGAASNSFWES